MSQDEFGPPSAWVPSDLPRASLRRDADAWPSPRARVLLLAALVLLHAIALHGLWRDRSTIASRDDASTATQLVFLLPDREPRSPPPPPDVRRDRPSSSRVPAAPSASTHSAPLSRSRAETLPHHRPRVAPASAPPDPPRAALFRRDGSIALPESVIDDLRAPTASARRFSYQVPGAMQARDFLKHPPALVYEATRFESAWIEEQDVVTEALQKVVEKTTATITIPIPRSPGSKVVCKVSLAALGGACGIVNNGEGYLVVLNDPDTLNADEDRQCQAWWEGIVAAKTPEDWREALQQYEAQCRKPLLSTQAPPRPDAAAAERARADAPAG